MAGKCGTFNYFDCLVTNDARYTCEIKSRIVKVKTAFHTKTSHQQTGLGSLRKKLVKRHIWSIALCDAEP
jgi:hypothetical protein